MIDVDILIEIAAFIVGFCVGCDIGYDSGWLRGQHDMLNIIEEEIMKRGGH